ncbi:MAG TPA: DUF2934 domain-containing protein [Candidatus Acidoferrales bacterium]|nr:DUF2934 domain-containing protein [Candidatus Acidoferrales bacterium]
MPSPRANIEIVSEEEAENEIAALAYKMWQERGCPIGSPEEDWYRAEEELEFERLPTAAA